MSAAVERREFALPFAASPDKEIFAIGDIHGRADLLAALIDEAAREPRRREKRAIVFLGDLVDRGPDSLGAIDLSIGAAERIGADEGIALMGNHEAMMRLALDTATPWKVAIEALEAWIANGGDRTLAEFVVVDEPPEDLDELLAVTRASLPKRVRAWLELIARELALGRPSVRSCRRQPAFRSRRIPRRPLEYAAREPRRRTPLGLGALAIPQPSAGAEGFSGVFVVHGHTPNDARRDASHKDQIAGFRLNLDAGSGLTGLAKMAIIRGRRAEVVAARGPSNRELMGE